MWIPESLICSYLNPITWIPESQSCFAVNPWIPTWIPNLLRRWIPESLPESQICFAVNPWIPIWIPNLLRRWIPESPWIPTWIPNLLRSESLNPYLSPKFASRWIPESLASILLRQLFVQINWVYCCYNYVITSCSPIRDFFTTPVV